jgi:uncharacterized protein (DUF433 family)
VRKCLPREIADRFWNAAVQLKEKRIAEVRIFSSSFRSVSSNGGKSLSCEIRGTSAFRISHGARAQLGVVKSSRGRKLPERGRSRTVKKADVVPRDPEVVSGALVFKGTRVPVEILIQHLAAGDSLDEFLENFPSVAREQAVAYLKMTPAAVDALTA